MKESDKLQEAIDRLTKKTRTREIAWNETLPDDAFIVSFPSHSVSIGPAPDGKGVTISLYDKSGRVFLEHTATSADVLGPGGALIGGKILELYQLVQAHTPRLFELDALLQELA